MEAAAVRAASPAEARRQQAISRHVGAETPNATSCAGTASRETSDAFTAPDPHARGHVCEAYERAAARGLLRHLASRAFHGAGAAFPPASLRFTRSLHLRALRPRPRGHTGAVTQAMRRHAYQSRTAMRVENGDRRLIP